MKKYVVGLLLLIAQNVCAMELEVTALLKKHSRNPNKKIRIGADHLIPMGIHQKLPLDVQRNIFRIMHEIYEVQRETFITQKICWFIHHVSIDNNGIYRGEQLALKDGCKLLMKNDLCQLLNKAENHVYLQKNNKDKVLEGCGKGYIRSNYLLPMNRVVIDMTETITAFVKEHYDPIIMFWYIVHTKQGRLL